MDLDWLSEDEYFILENFSETELIIAADIIYDNSLFEALLITVASIFKHSPHCEKFILVNAVRNPDSEREFLDMLGEIFFLNQSIIGKFNLILIYIFISAEYNLEYCLEVPPRSEQFYWKPNEILPIKIYCIRSMRK